MKLLVTGGGGFLGCAIVRQLRELGHEVISYSRKKHRTLDRLGVRQIPGDLAEYKMIKHAMIGSNAVFHVAAKTGTWGAYDDFYQSNVHGTMNVIQACRESGIRNLIFTSTASVVYHGKNSEGHNESLPYPKKFTASYPKTKAIAEQLVIAANDSQLKTVSLRPHLIWGPEDPHFLPRLFEKSKKGKLRILGHSHNLVDCTYIDNAAQAHIQAFNQLLHDPAQVEGKTYFISQDDPIPIADFINKLLASGALPPVSKHISPHLTYVAGWFLERFHRVFRISAEPMITLFLAQQLSTSHWYDISASKQDLGYKVEVSIDQGMERLRQWVSKTSNN